jgi:hypothetical protein
MGFNRRKYFTIPRSLKTISAGPQSERRSNYYDV